MDLIQALVIAILQGATELFPVSSLGHAVVLPALLHWGIDQHAPEFLPFLVMLHLGTATALLGYFWHDWWAILTGLIGIGGAHQVAESRRVFLLVVIATIPAVILGFLAEKFVRPHQRDDGFLALPGHDGDLDPPLADIKHRVGVIALRKQHVPLRIGGDRAALRDGVEKHGGVERCAAFWPGGGFGIAQ